MFPLRWPLILTAALFTAGGWAARRGRNAEPPEAPEVPTAEPEPTPAPAPSPEEVHQGPLFPDGLPLTELTLPDGLANPTSQGCAACHGDIQHHWQGSAHAQGWAGDAYQLAVRDASEPTTCQGCHLPLLAQHPLQVVHHSDGDPSSPQHAANSGWSPSLQREGVTCASCHLREGTILGPRGSTAAPHPTAASAELSSPALCAACHQLSWPDSELAWYDTYGEWYRSPYREAGVSCQDCHMPQQAGTVSTGRFAAHASHAMAVDAHRAVSVLAHIASPEISRGEPFDFALRIQNTGSGHAFPTGQPGKAYLVRAVVVDAEGEELHEPLEHRLERTVSPEPPYALVADERIPARGELMLEHQATISQKKPAGPSSLQVTIVAEQGGAVLVERSFPVSVI